MDRIALATLTLVIVRYVAADSNVIASWSADPWLYLIESSSKDVTSPYGVQNLIPFCFWHWRRGPQRYLRREAYCSQNLKNLSVYRYMHEGDDMFQECSSPGP